MSKLHDTPLTAAKAKSDEMQTLLYSISHDLSAPLRAVVSFAGLLEEKYIEVLDEKGRRYLRFVVDGGQKAQAMLNGLLQYSRIITQAQPFAPVECTPLVQICLQALHEEKPHIKATAEIAALPVVMGDESQIQRLFAILFENAFTFHMPDMPVVLQVSVIQEAQMWRFYVRDNGIGVPPGSTERVFQVFKRLHTDEEYPGIGMGLALAKRIVERHGGDIGCFPAEGQGTVFWFTLPGGLHG